MQRIDQLAALTYDWLKDPEKAVTMAAIIKAESGGDEYAVGDPARGALLPYAAFACNGHLSFGLAQIFLGVHTPRVQKMSGLTEPCDLANWLHDPNNNMRAAAAVLADGGFRAWSTFNSDAYLPYVAEAQLAMNYHLANLHVQPVTPPPPPPTLAIYSLEGTVKDENGTTFRLTVELREVDA